MKRLFLIVALAAASQVNSAHKMGTTSNLPPLITGTIQLHNTLNEPVSYKMRVVLNGLDPQSRMKITNSTGSSQGTIPAQATRQITSGYNFGGGDMWSVPVEITLQYGNHRAEHFALVGNILGTHNVTLSPSGELLLTKNQLEEKSEAAAKDFAQP